jgi:hypothetical protein
MGFQPAVDRVCLSLVQTQRISDVTVADREARARLPGHFILPPVVEPAAEPSLSLLT